MKAAVEIPEGLYPMRVVTRMTGLTADTIRAWERRYRAIDPPRSDGNTRRFTAGDIRRLLLLREATVRGHSIKAVADLSEDQLRDLVEQDQDLPTTVGGTDPDSQTDRLFDRIRDEYFDAIRRYDAAAAENLMSRAATFLRSRDLIYRVLLPIMQDTGELWAHDEFNVAQEHLVSMQLRAVLARLRAIQSPAPGARKIIATTPEGHYHEFGVLIGALLAADRGLDPVYLGPNLPEKDVLAAVERTRADLVLLGIARDLEPAERQALSAILGRLSDRVETWIGMPRTHPAWGEVPRVRYFDRFEDLEIAFAELTA